jgi:hypothetical protein
MRVDSISPGRSERFLLAAGAAMPNKPKGDIRIGIVRREKASGKHRLVV